MESLRAVLLVLAAACTAVLMAHAQPGGCPTVDYDVCVVGGGSSGMYAAWRLQQAKNLRVLVLENDEKVGGNCDTFYLDEPGVPGPIPVETGVLVYVNTSLVAQTIKALNIPTAPISSGAPPAPTYNWTSDGRTFSFPPTPSVMENTNAYNTWLALWRQYFEPYDTLSVTGRIPQFSSLPADVRRRLLSPFSDFLAELDANTVAALKPLFPLFAGIVNPGFASWLDSPAFYIAAGVTPATIKPFIISGDSTADGFVVANGCSSIYEAMAAALGPDRVVLNAAFDVKRQQNAVKVKVVAGTKWNTGALVRDAPCSSRTGTFSCRRLLISATPTVENLGTFIDTDKELDSDEQAVLSKVTHSSIFTHLVAVAPGTTAIGSVHVVVNARLADMPAASLAGVIGPLNLVRGLVTSLTPQWTIARGLAQFYNDVGNWGAVSGAFTLPPFSPSGSLASDVHRYFPRFKAPSTDWPVLYDSLFTLQVPEQPYKNTLYTGHMWSYDAQHYVWQYSETLVNTAKWTC